MDDIFGTNAEHTDVEVVDADAAGSSTGGKLFGGKLDARFRVVTSAYFDVDRVEKYGVGRNENRIEMYFAYTPNKHIQIVGDLEGVVLNQSNANQLNDLASRQMLEPFHLESDAAYLALLDVLPGLDIKLGRQLLVWGSADRFNPTNNLNPDDLEDRILFTEPIANQMAVVDFAPWGDKFWVQGVYVPVFYPALLPPSAAEALQDPKAPIPWVDQADREVMYDLRERMDANPALVPKINGFVVMPDRTFRNGQAAARVGTKIWDIDITASYYYGRHDIPTPVNVESTQLHSIDPAVVDPDDLVKQCCFVSDAFLVYPKMQVIGADLSTQIPFLNNMGLWGEAGLFLPEAKTFRIEFPISIVVNDELVTEYEGVSIRKRPFVKSTVGLDYTFGKHLYVQVQYLHGFIDEFGAGHLGDYLVAGTDLIFFGRHLIFRLFGVVDFPRKNYPNASGVVYPEIIIVPPWGFLTFELGGFALFGGSETKFGQKAAGSSIAFLKATGAF